MSEYVWQGALLVGQAMVGGAATFAVRLLAEVKAELSDIQEHLSAINGQVRTTKQRLDDHEVLCNERHDSHRREVSRIWGAK